jgi:plasmid stabilization system protein ParE
MGHQVLWSPEALEDLEALTAWLAASNVEAAVATGHAILRKTRGIPLHPRAGRVVPERNDPRIREVFHVRYRIIYRLPRCGGRVEILRIWHAARGEPSLPAESEL